MGVPKYVPAKFAVPKRMFGRARYVKFLDRDMVGPDPRAWASELQHLYAMRIRDSIAAKKWTIAEYAEKANVTADHMHKLLRGEAILKLEDIATADLLIGSVSEFSRQGTPKEPTEDEEVTLKAAEHVRLGRLAPPDGRAILRKAKR